MTSGIAPGRALAAATALVVLGTSAASLWAFGNAGHDDSHITYAAARSVWESGLPRNPNGEWVEQSSTAGFTVLLAVLAVLPVPLPILGVEASLVARGLTVAALVAVAERSRAGAGWLLLPVAATEPLQAYWGTSGMETTAAALGVVLLAPTLDVLLREGRALPWACASAWMVLVRPEGAVIAACLLAVGAVWAGARQLAGTPVPPRWLGLAVGVPALVTAGVTLVRQLAYGQALPQPVVSKMLTGRGYEHGKRYLDAHGALVSWTVLAAGALVLFGLARAWRRRACEPIGRGRRVRVCVARPRSGVQRARRRTGRASSTRGVPATKVRRMHTRTRQRGIGSQARPDSVLAELLAGGTLLATVAFTVLSGGDWMNVGRFLVAVAAAALGAVAVCARHLPLWALGLLAAALVGRHATVASGTVTKDGTGIPLAHATAIRDALPERMRGYPLLEYANIAHLRDIHLLDAIEEVLPTVRAKHGPGPIVVMSGQAGMVPYHLFERHDDLWFVDANSLATNAVNRCIPKKDMDNWPSGHHFDLRTFVQHADRIRDRCGVGLPAIVYESGPNARQALRDLPYTLVRAVPGVSRGAARLPSRPPVAGGWVAVRSDLLDPR